ncbi:MAG: NAD-dependent deacylase [Pseudomonadota bacterium]
MPQNPSSVRSAIAALGGALQSARHVCVLTGAGMSAESGVPTFRDAQSGLWAKYDPFELATPEAFAANPERVWDWYQYRRKLVARAEPNRGHIALVELAALVPELTLVTQNVDGLHQRAGSPDVIEFHGNLFENRCFAEGTVVQSVDSERLPYCPRCGSAVRPGVVWFGENIPEAALERASAGASACDLFLAIGTSAQVFPAAGLIDAARRAGATVAEINPQASGAVRDDDIQIAETAVSALVPLVNRLTDPRTVD